MAELARIAVLMTCFNRRDLTLACLETLRGQPLFEPANLFLVDDGSSDGTGDAVRASMPGATVIQGDGSLFWNGGMRLAWDTAANAGRDFDFYLWLNDDVTLAPGVLAMLVEDADATVPRGGAVIATAATCEPGGGAITYSGQRCIQPDRPLRLSLVAPQGHPVPVETVSGNIVLVSAEAHRNLGNLLPDFEHIFGDLDYGLRARAAGVPMIVASRIGGECDANTMRGGSLDPGLSKLERLRRRWAEDGKIHARDWRRFVRLHGGGGALTALGHRLSPYIRILLDRPHRHASTVLGAGPQGDGAP